MPSTELARGRCALDLWLAQALIVGLVAAKMATKDTSFSCSTEAPQQDFYPLLPPCPLLTYWLHLKVRHMFLEKKMMRWPHLPILSSHLPSREGDDKILNSCVYVVVGGILAVGQQVSLLHSWLQ